jgi:hypothetical protein
VEEIVTEPRDRDVQRRSSQIADQLRAAGATR